MTKRKRRGHAARRNDGSSDPPRDTCPAAALLAVAAFSTIVEWYDFTLYLYFATVLARVFYGGGSGSLLLTLGGFAIAYLMRPLGAVVFSHIGDKYGRRRMLLTVGGADDRGDAGDGAAADPRRDRARRRAGCCWRCVA